ncbi:MAG: aspartyl protease family protein [Planctomycetota bacterium]
MTLRLELRRFVGSFLLLLLAGVDSAGQESQDLARHAKEFRIEKHGDAILLPISLFGVTENFMVDSGASIHILDERFRRHLGRAVDTVGFGTAGADLRLRYYRPPRLSIGAERLEENLPVVSLDFTHPSQVIGHHIGGILGGPLFLQFIVSIDFDAGRLRLLPLEEMPRESWGIPIPVSVDSTGRPSIERVRVGSETRSFLLDTGFNSSLSLARPLFDQLQANEMLRLRRERRAMTAGGDVVRRIGAVNAIAVGPFRHQSIAASEGEENIIGLDYLSRFRVTFDLPRNRIYLAKGEAFSKADHAYKSGISVLWIEEKIVIAEIDENSPADRAGVESNDTLVAINGVPTKEMTLNEVRGHFRRQSGKTLTLSLQRDKQALNVSFALEPPESWYRFPANE